MPMQNMNSSNRVLSADIANRGIITTTVLNLVLKLDKLNICSVNIQSICADSKFDEFKLIFGNSRASVIVVTETWTKPRISNEELTVNNFKLFNR